MNGKKLNDIINDISKQRLNLEEKCNRRKIGVEAGSHNEIKRNIERVNEDVQAERRRVIDDVETIVEVNGREKIENICYEREMSSSGKAIEEKMRTSVRVLQEQQREIVENHDKKDNEISDEQKRLQGLFAEMQADIKI